MSQQSFSPSTCCTDAYLVPETDTIIKEGRIQTVVRTLRCSSCSLVSSAKDAGFVLSDRLIPPETKTPGT